MNDMMMRRKRKSVTLWVEWRGNEQAESLVRMLIGCGVRGVEIDRDVDVESFHSFGIKREHTVFRVLLGSDCLLDRLLTEVAMHPGVFSVGEI